MSTEPIARPADAPALGTPALGTPSLRTLWYMGAKTRLCPEFIEGAAADLLPEGGTFLDLCAGTAAVARYLAPRYRVLANDVQGFSSVVARAHLEGGERWRQALEFLEPEADLRRALDGNLRALERLMPGALENEASLLPRVIHELAARADETPASDAYRDLVAATPEPLIEPLSEPRTKVDPRYRLLGEGMPGLLRDRRRDPSAIPYALVTAYAGNVYFGLRQSITIDSLRRAIDAIPETDAFAAEKRTVYLAALVQACSVSTSGTSHFAQPRSIARDRELLAVARRRSIDIEHEFHVALDALRREWGTIPRHEGNRVFRSSADALLAPGGPLEGEGVGLVYLDPPYTSDHYSRFYHLLETIVDYDYPELAMRSGALTRGRYPVATQRFRSDFCSRETVEDAFRAVIEGAHRLGANLLISYAADQGLLMRVYADRGEENPVAKFRDLCLETYPHVEVRERTLMHSGQGDSNRAARELLVLCES